MLNIGKNGLGRARGGAGLGVGARRGYSATMCMEMAIRFQLLMVMVVKITWASFKTILSSSVKKGVSHQALRANSRWVELKGIDLFVRCGHRGVNAGLHRFDAHSFFHLVFVLLTQRCGGCWSRGIEDFRKNMYFLDGVFFLVRFRRLPRLFFEKVGKIKGVVESQFVGDFFDG